MGVCTFPPAWTPPATFRQGAYNWALLGVRSGTWSYCYAADLHPSRPPRNVSPQTLTCVFSSSVGVQPPLHKDPLPDVFSDAEGDHPMQRRDAMVTFRGSLRADRNWARFVARSACSSGASRYEPLSPVRTPIHLGSQAQRATNSPHGSNRGSPAESAAPRVELLLLIRGPICRGEGMCSRAAHGLSVEVPSPEAPPLDRRAGPGGGGSRGRQPPTPSTPPCTRAPGRGFDRSAPRRSSRLRRRRGRTPRPRRDRGSGSPQG